MCQRWRASLSVTDSNLMIFLINIPHLGQRTWRWACGYLPRPLSVSGKTFVSNDMDQSPTWVLTELRRFARHPIELRLQIWGHAPLAPCITVDISDTMRARHISLVSRSLTCKESCGMVGSKYTKTNAISLGVNTDIVHNRSFWTSSETSFASDADILRRSLRVISALT